LACAVVASSGCTSTVEGLAVRDADANPMDVQPLRASQLKDVLLSIGQLNGIVGATRMEIVLRGEEMSDNSDAVSDPDCLGSIYGAEHLVYRLSDWTAVRDQVAREPEDGNEHWVEQTAVLYPTEKKAADFVETSTSAWRDCSGFSVAVDVGGGEPVGRDHRVCVRHQRRGRRHGQRHRRERGQAVALRPGDSSRGQPFPCGVLSALLWRARTRWNASRVDVLQLSAGVIAAGCRCHQSTRRVSHGQDLRKRQ
jgi:hypothetical protein